MVIVFFRTILFMYLKPKSKEMLNSDNMDATDKLITVFYALMTPMMSLICSLRNKDVKEAVKRLLRRKIFDK